MSKPPMASVAYEILTHNSSRIAVLRLSNGPANGLSHALRAGIVSGLSAATKDKVDAIVLTGSKAIFSAGADIAEFESGTWSTKPDLGDVIDALDVCPVPTVAVVSGQALGGGLELALGCNYRIAGPSTKVGLPEVHLGIMPGAQGTQRLPRAAGVGKALDIILSGVPVNAKAALASRIVDKVADSDEACFEAGMEFAAGLKNQKVHPRLSQAKAAEVVPESVYQEAVAKLAQRGHVTAPKIVEAVKSTTLPNVTFRQGVETEAKLFRELMDSPEARGLQHMFFAERNCTKIPGVNPKKALEIKKVGVIGAGTMGSGIAMVFLNKKLPVVLCDMSEEALKRGVSTIENNYRRSSAFKTGKMTEDDLKKTMALLKTSTQMETMADLSDVDLVVEAVFESLSLKKSIFAKLDQACKPSTLLCTNTSYLSVDEIAAATKRPEMVMGNHFFSPANVMKLLENVKGAKTSDVAIATAMKVAKDVGKTAVLSGNAFGFIGNRMFEPYTQQAILMMEEGATPDLVDNALGPRGFGFAMGPLAVFDLAGNDIGYRIRKEPYYPHTVKNVKGARGATWMALADELCERKRYGQKTGKGWYSYQGDDKRKGTVDPEVTEMCKVHAAKYKIAPNSKLDPQTIVDRCVLSMVNEGFRILEDKIAVRSSDIDVVWNYGYGFPRYRGGPMHYADSRVGLKQVREKMLRLLEEQPELPRWHFEPAPLLEQLVKDGKTLKQFEA